MKTYIKPIASIMASLAMLATAQAKNILETAKDAGNFTILAKAVKAAGLEGALTGNTKLTVFAPTDDAFMRLPKGTIETLLKPENKDTLIDILTYHVVAGEVSGGTAVTLKEATALNKKKLQVSFKNAALYLNKSKVVATDIKADNGIIHVIDNVLIPAKNKVAKKSKRTGPVSEIIFTDAIDIGVDLFNEGNHKACAKIYEIAVRAVYELKPKNISKGNLENLKKALDKVAESDDYRENAWTLRYAINKTF